MNKHLHIVCLDAPYPIDYGGAVDMYGKIKALYHEGIRIHLHYFDHNGRCKVEKLRDYCESVRFYERKEKWKGFSFQLPYIVSSRINQELIEALNKDDHPVILEGIHCMGILEMISREGRKILVRLHNDEQAYYKKLAGLESNLLKKSYFMHESMLLGKYQCGMPKDCTYVCVSQKDQRTFHQKYHLPHVEFLPVFVAWNEVTGKEGMGNFCLYHGNLSIAENEKAALWLIDKVFSKIKIPFVIAGKDPSRSLQKMAHLYQHTCLVANPDEKAMHDLLQKAHINVLPSFNNTGIKLKMLHALYKGRHCVVNEAAVEGSGLEEACHIGTNDEAIASIILQLYHQPYTEEEKRLREMILHNMFNAQAQAKKLIAWLY